MNELDKENGIFTTKTWKTHLDILLETYLQVAVLNVFLTHFSGVEWSLNSINAL